MIPVHVRMRLVRETLTALQDFGRDGSERVVFWLANQGSSLMDVDRLFIPAQEASYDYFRVPEGALAELFGELRRDRSMVAAQVHTHPEEAFHSYTDDRLATIRHAGGLSLVVPYFAQHTSVETFARDSALFVLSNANQWVRVKASKVAGYYRIVS